MLIWIWGSPLPTAKVEAWTLQGHRVVHRDFDEAEPEAEPDLVLITDGEDSPEQSQRLEALRSLAMKSVKTKVLFHAVAQPFPSDGLVQWAAWNAWPDALESDCWEIAIPAMHDSEALRLEWRALAAALQLELVFCPNRGGMVTPRVLACLINEAYLTRDQGVATAEDIDLGMRYGTNYPRGPFEWCQRIGAPRIVRALDAWAALDPAQDAYKVADGLRQEALSQQNKLL